MEILPKLRRIQYSVQSTGLRHTLSDLATHFLTYDSERDNAFDRQFGTNTTTAVQTEQLGIEDSEARKNAILYKPSPERMTRWLIDNSGVEPRDVTFVDLGCGKGRVLLIASEYDFKRVVGVEISSELAQIARTNVNLYQARSRARVEVVNADATQFDFPETDLLLHLYHPFEPAVTDRVLTQLERSLERTPRRVRIAYLTYSGAVDIIDEAFARHPRFKRLSYKEGVLGQYNCLYYST